MSILQIFYFADTVFGMFTQDRFLVEVVILREVVMEKIWNEFFEMSRKFLSWLYTYRFSRFDMFVHYFVRLRTNHYTLFTISHFGHLWFCEKLDEKLALSSSLTFCENTDRLAIMAKRKMRKMIGEMVYEMPSIRFSFLSFCRHFFTFSSIWQSV